MSDISDPGGAGRGDRRTARRAVDAAYTAGRISAVDRSLRMEQIDAAATRGDLAMVVRDLTDRPADPPPPRPAPSSDAARAPFPRPPAAEQPAPSAGSSPVPDPPATSPGDAPGRAWPPPGFGGTPEVGEHTSGTNRRTIGCIVGVVAFFFLAPCLLGAGGLVVSLVVSGSDGDSSDGVAVEQVEQWWDERVDDLAAASGTTVVSAYRVGEDTGTATTEESTASTDWTYSSGVWVEGMTRADLPELPVADLARIDASAVQSAVDDARFAVDTDADPTIMIRVRPQVGQDPLLEVTVGDGAAVQSRTYDSDGLLLQD